MGRVGKQIGGFAGSGDSRSNGTEIYRNDAFVLMIRVLPWGAHVVLVKLVDQRRLGNWLKCERRKTVPRLRTRPRTIAQYGHSGGLCSIPKNGLLCTDFAVAMSTISLLLTDDRYPHPQMNPALATGP
jgi:hypothetical protein